MTNSDHEPIQITNTNLLEIAKTIEEIYDPGELPSDWVPGDFVATPKGLIEYAQVVLARYDINFTSIPKSGPIDDWNAQADSANQWDSLDVDEKVDWLENWAKCWQLAISASNTKPD